MNYRPLTTGFIGLCYLLQLASFVVRASHSPAAVTSQPVTSNIIKYDDVIHLLHEDSNDVRTEGERYREGGNASTSVRFIKSQGNRERGDRRLSRRERRSRRGFGSADEDEIIRRLNDVRRTYPASNMQAVTYDNQLEGFITMWALHCNALYASVSKSKYSNQTFRGIYATTKISIETAQTDLFANLTDPFLYANIVSIGCTQRLCSSFLDESAVHIYQSIYLFACLVGFNGSPEWPIASNVTCSACSPSYLYCDNGLCSDVPPVGSGPPPPPPSPPMTFTSLTQQSVSLPNSVCNVCQTRHTPITPVYQDDSWKGSSIGAVIGVVCGVTLFVVLVSIISLHIIVYRRKMMAHNRRRRSDNDSPVNIYSLPPPTSSSTQDGGHVYVVPISQIVSPPPYSECRVYSPEISNATAPPPPYTVLYDNVAKEIKAVSNELPLSMSTSVTSNAVADVTSVSTFSPVTDDYNLRTESTVGIEPGSNFNDETAPPLYENVEIR